MSKRVDTQQDNAFVRKLRANAEKPVYDNTVLVSNAYDNTVLVSVCFRSRLVIILSFATQTYQLCTEMSKGLCTETSGAVVHTEMSGNNGTHRLRARWWLDFGWSRRSNQLGVHI